MNLKEIFTEVKIKVLEEGVNEEFALGTVSELSYPIIKKLPKELRIRAAIQWIEDMAQAMIEDLDRDEDDAHDMAESTFRDEEAKGWGITIQEINKFKPQKTQKVWKKWLQKVKATDIKKGNVPEIK